MTDERRMAIDEIDGKPGDPIMFDKRVVLVTGGGSGIGRATAVMLARGGATVVIADSDEAAGRRSAAAIDACGGVAVALPIDATKGADLAHLIAEIDARFGNLHIAVNGVGGGETGTSIVGTTERNWSEIVERNLTSTWLAMRNEIPLIARSGGGAIVNIASMAGVDPIRMSSPAYAAAKAGVIHLTRYGAQAHAADHIRINSVSPGLTRTPLVEEHLSNDEVARIVGESQFIKRMSEPEEVAATVCFLCSDGAAMITGSNIPVTGGA